MLGHALLAVAAAQTVEFADVPTGSLRTRGMGGANVAVAEGASTVPDNPAAMALRRSFRTEDRLELDSSAQLGTFPLLNSGYEWLRDAPLDLPHPRARWRIGIGGRAARLGVGLSAGEESLESAQGRFVSRRYALGAGWAGEQFAVGVTPELLQFRREVPGSGLEGSLGGGATAGGLWTPRGSPVRVGARLRTPMRTAPLSDGSRLRVPMEAAVGVALVVGATNAVGRYGPRWSPSSPGADRWLLDVDVLLTGAGGEAVAVMPLLEDGVRREVGGVTARMRAGVEWATLEDRLRLRAGLATVPGRGDAAGVRATLGAGLEVFELLGLSYRLAGYVGGGPEGWSAGVGGETW